jgi:hypothetical protein
VKQFESARNETRASRNANIFGQTGDFAHAAPQDVDEVSFVTGIRFVLKEF